MISHQLAKIYTDIAQICTSQNRPNAQLMAVTKYFSIAQTQAVLDAGHLLLGENKVKDGIAKQQACPLPKASWHLIGHLQTNKVKKAVAHFDCIQSVDSEKVLHAINIESQKIGKIMPIFLELNIGGETSKSGFILEELFQLAPTFSTYSNVKIEGLMVIPPFFEDPELTRPFFRQTRDVFTRLQKDIPSLKELSMGMSHDYCVALEEGSTFIRVGSFLLL